MAMKRIKHGRQKIIKAYAEMIFSGEDKKLNVVRTVASRVGYTIDPKKGNSSFVRKVINETKTKIALPEN